MVSNRRLWDDRMSKTVLMQVELPQGRRRASGTAIQHTVHLRIVGVIGRFGAQASNSFPCDGGGDSLTSGGAKHPKRPSNALRTPVEGRAKAPPLQHGFTNPP